MKRGDLVRLADERWGHKGWRGVIIKVIIPTQSDPTYMHVEVYADNKVVGRDSRDIEVVEQNFSI